MNSNRGTPPWGRGSFPGRCQKQFPTLIAQLSQTVRPSARNRAMLDATPPPIEPASTPSQVLSEADASAPVDRESPTPPAPDKKRRRPRNMRKKWTSAKHPRCPHCRSIDIVARRSTRGDDDITIRDTICRSCDERFFLILE